MLDKLKNFLSKYKVHVAVVGGVLVVATTFGTCSFEPSSTSDNAVSTSVEVMPVSSVAEATNAAGTTGTISVAGATGTTGTEVK
jgi:hypothetical protein